MQEECCGRREAAALSVPVRLILRLEAVAVAAGLIGLYAALGAGWLLFFVLILAPDLSLLAYLAGPRIGAAAYNLAHTYVLPALLALLSLQFSVLLPVALIFAAHIAIDRALGFGLKCGADFKATHLGVLGGRAGFNSEIERGPFL